MRYPYGFARNIEEFEEERGHVQFIRSRAHRSRARAPSHRPLAARAARRADRRRASRRLHDADSSRFGRPRPDPFNPATIQLIDDTSWELVGWRNADGSARDIPHGDNGEPIKLALSTKTGVRRAAGFSGCNRYMGTYDVKNGVLAFGPLAGTRMACVAPARAALERDYLAALGHISKAGVQMRAPQQLIIITDDGATLTFARRDSE